MAISKIVYGDSTLIDLTNDTVEADNLLSGFTAHNKAGETITGTLYPAVLFTGYVNSSSNTTSIKYTDLPAEPKAFAIIKNNNTTPSTTRTICGIWYNPEYSSTLRCQTCYKSGSNSYVNVSTTCTYTYSNGTLTIKSGGASADGYFVKDSAYRLLAIC